ncbi:HAD-IC family P-type ATPase, partial [Acidimicrobiaceae bacterium USS-CC1]|nr:HAD-IC family P-type ATPase [Acidiferrimicrobium australe]
MTTPHPPPAARPEEAPGPAPPPDAHHALAAHEVVLLLGTDVAAGLTSHEVQQRRRRFGANELREVDAGGPLRRLLGQVDHPLVIVLLVSAVVALLLGETVDAAVIFGVVVANTVIGFVQESRAEAALDALRALVRTAAQVRRDGRRQSIASVEVVPGDVAIVEAGDKVPADLRLVESVELRVDESALTGESLPVAKDEVALAVDTPVADRRNMVYSGTLVTHGAGTGVVVATGEETELGEIHRLVSSAEELETPLTRKLDRFSRLLTVVIVGLAALTFLVGVARGERVAGMFSA